MKLIKHIPNTITLLNITCGVLAIQNALTGSLSMAAWLIIAAAVFDFLDGFMARMLKAYSEIGKQLDSLCDVVSFGVAPGFIMYKLIENSQTFICADCHQYMPMIAFIIPAFSALRLAKFNVDTRQTTSFIGLPTPANAIFILSFPLILEYTDNALASQLIHNEALLVITTIVFSLLLTSEIPLFAMKFKSFGWRENKTIYIFLLLSLILLVTLQVMALPFIIIMYVLVSIINHLFCRKHEVQS